VKKKYHRIAESKQLARLPNYWVSDSKFGIPEFLNQQPEAAVMM